jgi:hypothetical protein
VDAEDALDQLRGMLSTYEEWIYSAEGEEADGASILGETRKSISLKFVLTQIFAFYSQTRGVQEGSTATGPPSMGNTLQAR